MNKNTKSKKIETRDEFALLKHEFTREETAELTAGLTKGLRNISELQEQKKALGAEYSAKIKTQQAAISEIANKLDSGFEMKEMACEVDFDYPARMKRFYALKDNGKRGGISKEEPMSEIDLQIQLPIKDPVVKPAKGDKAAEAKDGEKTADTKPKRARKKKDAQPGQPLVSVEEAMPASHEMAPVRGELVGD